MQKKIKEKCIKKNTQGHCLQNPTKKGQQVLHDYSAANLVMT